VIMIWRIFRKDWKLLWPVALGVGGLNLALRLVLARIGLFPTFRVGSLVNLLVVGGLFGVVILITLAVQQDPVPGVRQDWLVRPIRRRDLLMSKLLFVLVAAQGPVFLAEVIQGLANGFPLAESIAAPLARNFWLLLILDLPILAFATLSSNLMEAVFGGLILFLGGAILVGALNVLGVPQPTMDTGIQWITYSLMALVAFIAASVVLGIQYRGRKTLAARFAFTGAGMVWISSLLLPWTPAFAAEQRLSPAPRLGSAVALTLDPTVARFRLPPGTGLLESIRKRDIAVSTVYIPLRVQNMPADSMLLIDHCRARFGAGASSVEATGANIHLPADASKGLRFTAMGVPAAWLAKHGSEPVHVEIEYSLTLAGAVSRYSIPAAGGELRSPDLGWCQSRINPEDTNVQIHCMRPGKQPDATCFTLENTSTGVRNPEVTDYIPNYSPSLLAFIPDSMRRAGANLPFRDPFGVARYPVDGSQLNSARVAIRTYAAHDHFTRHLRIDGVRLNDWRGADEAGM
jgi:hypothetical protein